MVSEMGVQIPLSARKVLDVCAVCATDAGDGVRTKSGRLRHRTVHAYDGEGVFSKISLRARYVGEHGGRTVGNAAALRCPDAASCLASCQFGRVEIEI